MKIFDRITLRTFRRGTEGEERVVKAMLFASGLDEPPTIEITELEGYGSSPLESMELKIGRQQDIKTFWNSLPEEVILEILESLDKRLDDGQVLHFRFDKEKAYMGEIAIVSKGAVISVEAKVLSYPANREAALSNAEEFLHKILQNRAS